MKAIWMLLASEILPMAAGMSAPPIIAMTSKEELGDDSFDQMRMGQQRAQSRSLPMITFFCRDLWKMSKVDKRCHQKKDAGDHHVRSTHHAGFVALVGRELLGAHGS